MAVDRFFSGSDKQSGELHVTFTNRDPNTPAVIRYFDAIPYVFSFVAWLISHSIHFFRGGGWWVVVVGGWLGG